MEASTAQPFGVVDQQHTIGPRPDNSFGGLWTITAESHGVKFQVQVNDESYNAPTVAQLLAEKAATIAAIQQLGTTQPAPPQ